MAKKKVTVVATKLAADGRALRKQPFTRVQLTEIIRRVEVATAELLTSQLPEVRIVSTIASSSVSDTNDPGEFADFASRNEDRITTESAPMLSPSDLVQLPKGQAFALIHGGQLHKIRMPLPDAGHDPLMPASLEAIGAEIRGRAARPTFQTADDDPRVNPNGGAIALGHPLGMTGARLSGSAALELALGGGRHALVAMCIGVGQGIAVALQRV